MKTSTLAYLTLATIGFTSAQEAPDKSYLQSWVEAQPTSKDALEVLSPYFWGTIPPSVTSDMAFATSFASAVYSVDYEFYVEHGKEALPALWSAAAQATNGPEVVESMQKTGFDMGSITTNDWYQENVPADVKTVIDEYVGEQRSVQSEFFGESVPAETSSGLAAAATGRILAAAAAAGAAVVGVAAL